jgi:hypothetical protein
MYRVELSKRALRDLRRIDHRDRKRLLDLLQNDLAAEPPPANLDIKQLTGRAPWLRIRRGEYLCAPLSPATLLAFVKDGAANLDEFTTPGSAHLQAPRAPTRGRHAPRPVRARVRQGGRDARAAP